MPTIKALYYAVGKEPELLDIDNGLPALQKAVGGYIEAVRISEDVALICNEEGKIHGLKPNRWLDLGPGRLKDTIMGDFLVVGAEDPEFVSLSDDQISIVLSLLSR